MTVGTLAICGLVFWYSDQIISPAFSVVQQGLMATLYLLLPVFCESLQLFRASVAY